MVDIKRVGGALAIVGLLVAMPVIGCVSTQFGSIAERQSEIDAHAGEAPKDASELVARMGEVGVLDNCHVDGSTKVVVSYEDGDQEFSLVTAGDVCGRQSHLKLSSTELGKSAEAYVAEEPVNAMVYYNRDGSMLGFANSSPQTSWGKFKVRFDALLREVLAKGLSEQSSVAGFAVNDDGTYTLTFDGEAVRPLSEVLDEEDGYLDVALGLGTDDVVRDGHVEVNVSKDFRIMGISGDVRLSSRHSDSNVKSISFDFDLSFSRQGQVGWADVAVPLDVSVSAEEREVVRVSWDDDVDEGAESEPEHGVVVAPSS